MNKKGLNFNLQVLIAFTFVALIFMFSAVFVQQIGEDYLLKETGDIGITILNQSTGLTTPQDKIREVQSDWTNWNIPYDLFFLFTWIMFIGFTVKSSFEANKEGIFSFFGYIFIGSMLLLLITSYVATFSQWFLVEIFYNVFDDLSFSLPIFNFYMENLGIINFVWWIGLLGINFIDRRFISRTGEVEE